MLKLKKKVAFELMVKSFGPWNTWDRASHLAYGLIRGIDYSRMERCSNDNPHAVGVVRALWQLGAWEEHPYAENKCAPRACYDEVSKLVVWVKKIPRSKTITGEVVEELDSSIVVSNSGILLGGEVA